LGSKFLGGAKRGTARESSDDQSNLGFQIAFEVNRTPRLISKSISTENILVHSCAMLRFAANASGEIPRGCSFFPQNRSNRLL